MLFKLLECLKNPPHKTVLIWHLVSQDKQPINYSSLYWYILGLYVQNIKGVYLVYILRYEQKYGVTCSVCHETNGIHTLSVESEKRNMNPSYKNSLEFVILSIFI